MDTVLDVIAVGCAGCVLAIALTAFWRGRSGHQVSLLVMVVTLLGIAAASQGVKAAAPSSTAQPTLTPAPTPAPTPDKTTWLDTIQPLSPDKIDPHTEASLDNKSYPHTLGVSLCENPQRTLTRKLTYIIDSGYTEFHALIGFTGTEAVVTFEVRGDNDKIIDSKKMATAGMSMPFDVTKPEGVKKITLVATVEPGHAFSCKDLVAQWAEAKVITR